MKPIKFRSWAHGSMWLVNGLACSDGSDEMDLIDDSIGGYREVKHYDVVESRVLMQYTGLKDKNDKEVYEGDIVKQTYHLVTGNYDDQMAYDGYHIGEVIVTASAGVCMRKPLCYSEETDETKISNQYKKVAGYRCEIIGNIYEHPHLLKAGES